MTAAARDHACRIQGAGPGVAADPITQANLVLRKTQLAPQITELLVYCPEIASSCKPGQFVIVHADETAERIPLTIADFDRKEGTITMVIQELGTSTAKICRINPGRQIRDIVGPLGHASEVSRLGTVVCVGGGVGVAPVYPIARGLKEAGNKVISIIGARSAAMLFWKEKMASVSDELIVTTDNGEVGLHGFVTDGFKTLTARGEKISRLWAIGPLVMMRAVAKATREAGVPTVVSLNSVMIDGTGMCGGCRVSLAGKSLFTCVDGPEFDGHAVDFDGLLSRLGSYKEQEARSLEGFRKRDERISGMAKRKDGRVPMPEQDPKIRKSNFREVALGYDEEMAMSEAMRCIQCKKPACMEKCPVNINIPGFIKKIQEGDFPGALGVLKEKNNLPAVCGRVCPQETQCEQTCILGKKGEAVAIGRLERFAADYAMEHGGAGKPAVQARRKERVAVIGAGPAGLTAAADLALLGYKVVVYEALHKAGGVLAYGIPEFRLPKRIVQIESDALRDLGVEFCMNKPIGLVKTVDELMRNEGFDAVFIGVGTGAPNFMGIPGENLNGVASSSEFLTRINLMKAYLFPAYDTPVVVGRRVAVVGGGNVALDSARSALRMGPEKVYLVYRRSREEMPAREEEVHHAFDEGVEFMPLTNPVRILDSGKGWVKGMECVRMELGEPDASGRRRPVPLKGSEHVLDVDQVIMAIGQSANPILTRSMPGLKLTKWGNIEADPATGATSMAGVFAGGDIVTGAATVIEAMGAGKRAAAAIDAYLRGKG